MVVHATVLHVPPTPIQSVGRPNSPHLRDYIPVANLNVTTLADTGYHYPQFHLSLHGLRGDFNAVIGISIDDSDINNWSLRLLLS